MNIFVFSLLAPFVLPIINQVKTELNTGSSEIIQSSKEKQLIVFRDDSSTDPTHSMLSKDHFSNILNEPAGKVASQVLKWVVPQLIACWDDERIDVDRTLTRVVNGVFHHPALRDYGDDGAVDGRRLMFGIVQEWWGSKDEQERQIMRDQLSRDGVEQGRNHKPGVVDSGHGCCKPLGMPTARTANSSGAIGGLPGGLAGGAILGGIGSALAGGSTHDGNYTSGSSAGASGGIGKFAEEAVGGGALGGLVGGLAGGLGGNLLGEAFGGSGARKQTYQKQKFEEDGSYTQSVTETGYSQPQYGNEQRYGQAEYSQTNFVEGGQRKQFQRYEQEGAYGGSGYGQQVIQESRPTYGGGYEQTTEKRYERPGGEWQSEVRVEGRESESGGFYEETKRYSGHGGYKKDDSEDDSDEHKKHHKKKHHKKEYGYDSDDEKNRYGRGEQERLSTYEAGPETRQGYGGQTYGGQSYGSENRYQEPRPAYESGGYGGGREYESQQQSYAGGSAFGGGGGYGGVAGGYGAQEERREEYAQEERREEYVQEERREEYAQEERREEFGENRRYGGDEEYQERRGYGEEGGYGDEDRY